MANPLTDIQRAVGSLAVLPDIGRHIAKMSREVTKMRQAVEDLPKEIALLREEVEALHVDMKQMVDDVAELKGMSERLDDIRGDLQRLPFVGPGRRASRAAAAKAPPAVEEEPEPPVDAAAG